MAIVPRSPVEANDPNRWIVVHPIVREPHADPRIEAICRNMRGFAWGFFALATLAAGCFARWSSVTRVMRDVAAIPGNPLRAPARVLDGVAQAAHALARGAEIIGTAAANAAEPETLSESVAPPPPMLLPPPVDGEPQ